MTDFVKGDTVQLKSGGPIMTVTDVGEHQIQGSLVWTMWFDGKKKMDDTFPPEALKKATPFGGVASVSLRRG